MAADMRTAYVTYVTEHGTPPSSFEGDVAQYGSVFYLPSSAVPELTDPDYTFLGWYLTETFDEDTKVIDGAVDYLISHSYTITLYAKWGPNGYTLTYNNKYGTTPNPVTTSDESYTSSTLPTLSFSYATFVGWYTTATFDEGTMLSVGDTINADITLYAKWEPTERHRVNAADIYTLAETIRALEGSTAAIKVEDMAAKIRALGGVDEITFTIDGTSYTAEEGMTWEEWVESEYNTIDAYLIGDEIKTVYTYSGDRLIDVNGGSIRSTDIIVADYNYNIETGMPNP